MNTLIARIGLPGFAIVLLLMAPAASAQNIYKCMQGGTVAYTDHPCPGGKGELLHRADDSEVIDQYLRLGQQNLARKYADARHLDALYQARLATYQQDQQEKAQRAQDEALAAQQQQEESRQQALFNQAAERNRLQAENNALRQQNDQYRDELTQPATTYVPAYWGGAAAPYPRRAHDHDHDGDHGHHPLPKEPTFHPCTQLAGGRVQC